jgi:Bifunctional DNA primase/polymerase, N-terminal/Primase C terminal 1 (PriCT-1)
MGLFREIAEPLIAKGIPVIPLRPRTKIAFLTGWEALATTDPKKIEQWDEDYPDANGACVAFARPGGIWFLEIDCEGFTDEIERATGQKIPLTLTVRSSKGRGHFYFRQTSASIAMGNVQGRDENGKETFSARVDNRYVVAPFSWHPSSGKQYELLRDVEPVEAPDWLVQWCLSQKLEDVSEKIIPADTKKIPSGFRNNALTSLLGRARQTSELNATELLALGMRLNQERCEPPLSEQEVRTIAQSIGKYSVKEVGAIVFGNSQTAVTPPSQPVTIKPVPYPSFPRWVIDKTSIGEGLVKPICSINNSYPEFIFMPAMILFLNYIALKVVVQDKNIIPSFYMVSIGQKGRAFKSSGVKSAIEYFGHINYVKTASKAITNAEGRSLIWTPGSTEGLGLEMDRTNCRNVVMFFDEFKTLVDKASIEKSSMAGHISVMYESDIFTNTIKSRKEAFTHEAGQYCASLIACTTDEAFADQWAKMPTTGELGLDDRFFFLFQPEVWLPVKPQKMVNTVVGAVETKRRIDKAVLQKTYVIANEDLLESVSKKVDGARGIGLVEKLALYFAVDLGKDDIDEGCIDRAVAIVKYGIAVKKYLETYESLTREGDLQQKIIRTLRRNGGAMKERELERTIHALRYGTYMFNRSYEGLLRSGWIAETGVGSKGDPKQTVLMRLPEAEDE